MFKQSFTRSFFLLLITFLIILSFQVLNDIFPIINNKYRSFSFFQGWAGSNILRLEDPASIDSSSTKLETDSVLPAINKDTLQLSKESSDSIIILQDTSTGLDHFSQAMHELVNKKRKKIRIAWFGDSMIEGDLIVMTLRNSIQKRYGGEGVGMMPLTSPVAGFRITIRHSFSDNWKEWNIINNKSFRFPPGLFCSVYAGNVTAEDEPFWVTYKASTTFKNTSVFSQGWLFYGSPKMLNENMVSAPILTEPKFDLWSGERFIKSIPFDTTGTIHKLNLFSEPMQEFTLYFNSDSVVPLYGISIESDTGIIVDNFASRGNSGIGLWPLDDNLLKSFQDMLHYDLIILQFGTNAMSPGMTNYNWYGNSMNKVLAKLKRCFSGSSFLLISVADRAMKNETSMQTDPGVQQMVNVQRRIASANNMRFLNLYSSMGGEGTIVKWVEQEEPWANKDYTHLNYKGARKISDIILSFILNDYQSSEMEVDSAVLKSVYTQHDTLP